MQTRPFRFALHIVRRLCRMHQTQGQRPRSRNNRTVAWRALKYYRFWIADFESKTNALSNSQRGVYLLLLNHCYMHERGLPGDLNMLYSISRAVTETDRADVGLVLATYFKRNAEGGYFNSKAEEILREMQEYSTAQKERSALGVAARQKPKRTKGDGQVKPAKPEFILPDWIPADAWAGWLEARKKMKVPATQRAMELALADLEKLRAAGNDPRAVLDQAAMRGYRGLFEVKEIAVKQAGTVSPDREDWWSNDGKMLAKANALGLHSAGLSRDELRAKIQNALGKN